METKKLFEKYYARLRLSGILKSLVCAGAIGFGVMFGVALTLWFMDPAVWEVIVYSLGSGILATALITPLFYFTRFRPSTQGIARMIDRLGLEERVITMYELEKDESFMALKQREDAKAKLQTVNEKQLKFHVSVVALILLISVGVIGLGMTTVSVLGAHGIIDKEAINEPIEQVFDRPNYCEVNYVAYGFGTIDGELAQLVEEGEDATPVVAVADEGYIFMGWDDGVETPDRWDRNLHDHLFVNAVFVPIQESEDGESMENPNEDMPEDDAPSDAPDSGEDNEGEESEQPPSVAPPTESDSTSSGTGGSQVYDDNTIIDGETDYSAEFEYDSNMEDLAGDESMPPDLKDSIGGYYDSLKP